MSDIKTNNLESSRKAILIKDLMAKWESNRNRLLVFEKYLKSLEGKGYNVLSDHSAEIKFRYVNIKQVFLEYDEICTKIEVLKYSECFTINEHNEINSIAKHPDFNKINVLLFKEREEMENLLNRVKKVAEGYLRYCR